MAQAKRSKHTGNIGKKKAAAKQALKKNRPANKSRNDELREKLDRESLSLRNDTLREIPNSRPELDLPTMDIAESLTDLTDILRNL